MFASSAPFVPWLRAVGCCTAVAQASSASYAVYSVLCLQMKVAAGFHDTFRVQLQALLPEQQEHPLARCSAYPWLLVPHDTTPCQCPDFLPCVWSCVIVIWFVKQTQCVCAEQQQCV
jgi:hypothetical protein